jgi:hypothetical protein
MNDSNCEGGQPLPSVPSDALFGSPLAEVTDADQLREMADKLWSLLDDIDTASDQFKPSNEAGCRRFYEYAMKKAGARHAIITSDGYDLYLPSTAKRRIGYIRSKKCCGFWLRLISWPYVADRIIPENS